MLYHPSPHILLTAHPKPLQPVTNQQANESLRVIRRNGFDIPILQADEHFLCINKPPFLRIDAKDDPAQASDEDASTVQSILNAELSSQAQNLSHLTTNHMAAGATLKQTHQLDANTSGVFLYAKHKYAASETSRLFEGRKAQKTYIAIVHGHVNIHKLCHEANIDQEAAIQGPSTQDERTAFTSTEGKVEVLRIDAYVQAMSSQKCAVVPSPAVHSPGSRGKGFPQSACTLLQTLKKTHVGPAHRLVTLVQLQPVTGRRHQLRLHCAAIGHAILGDWLYEQEPSHDSGRLCLHACRLEMVFPDGALLSGDRRRKNNKKRQPCGEEPLQPVKYVWQTELPFADILDP